MKDPTQVAQKWSRNLSASTDVITAGVNAVTVAPGQLAARQKTLWLQKLQQSADKWARNVAAVSVESWKDAMLNKGVGRIGTGATAAEAKFATFMQSLLQYEDNLRSSLPARGTTEQNINRMVQFVTGMTKYRKPA